jgi:IS1 family transposase
LYNGVPLFAAFLRSLVVAGFELLLVLVVLLVLLAWAKYSKLPLASFNKWPRLVTALVLHPERLSRSVNSFVGHKRSAKGLLFDLPKTRIVDDIGFDRNNILPELLRNGLFAFVWVARPRATDVKPLVEVTLNINRPVPFSMFILNHRIIRESLNRQVGCYGRSDSNSSTAISQFKGNSTNLRLQHYGKCADKRPRKIVGFLSSFCCPSHFAQLPSGNTSVNRYHYKRSPHSYYITLCEGVFLFLLYAVISFYVFWQAYFGPHLWRWLIALPILFVCGVCGVCGVCLFLDGLFNILDSSQEPFHQHGDFGSLVSHANTVPQKYHSTSVNYRGTVIAIGRMNMANVLSIAKQVAVISALAEGSGIRQAEHMTGVDRETIMNIGVRVGKGCTTLLDRKMRGLTCHQLQFDELWGFIGKKERHVRPGDDPQLGDVWTFCAIDRDTKLVPSFKVGKRDLATANAFVADVASRVKYRVQISSDALRAYVDAIEMNFGADVDFAQIVKTYIHEDSANAERKYSASEIVLTEKKSVTGFPNMRLASTSNVERLNGTTRLHMRRLTRLTYAFSKKLENFEAAVGLHFAYYNFVKRHNTLRVTPAMEAGIERDFWTVENLIEAAA